ncbi:MAG TPA: hypothetical protein VIL78_02510 [Hanamia sp.]
MSSATWFKFEKDAIGLLHEHSHTKVIYVECGVFEMTIRKEEKIIKND